MNGFYTDIFKDDKQIGEGFKTTLSGQVTKYDVNVDDKGSFVCNLEFVSSNYALLDKTVDDDNNLFIQHSKYGKLLVSDLIRSVENEIKEKSSSLQNISKIEVFCINND